MILIALQNIKKIVIMEMNKILLFPYPGFKNVYDDFVLFCSKFKIKYEADDRFWDYNADRDRYRYRYCFSDSDSD